MYIITYSILRSLRYTVFPLDVTGAYLKTPQIRQSRDEYIYQTYFTIFLCTFLKCHKKLTFPI